MARSIVEHIQVGNEQYAREVVATSRGKGTRTYDVTVNGLPAGIIRRNVHEVTSREWGSTSEQGYIDASSTLYGAMTVLARRAY